MILKLSLERDDGTVVYQSATNALMCGRIDFQFGGIVERGQRLLAIEILPKVEAIERPRMDSMPPQIVDGNFAPLARNGE